MKKIAYILFTVFLTFGSISCTPDSMEKVQELACCDGGEDYPPPPPPPPPPPGGGD